MPVPDALARVRDLVRDDIGAGEVHHEIPALAKVDPRFFGIAFAGVDGSVVGVGDWTRQFSIQSISKLFSLALLLSLDGDEVWQHVGRHPSAAPYNELPEIGGPVPRNPFINAGALVVVGRLLELMDDPRRSLLDLLRVESGNPSLRVDENVVESERAHGGRNAVIADLIATSGRLSRPSGQLLEQYLHQCAIAMSCAELAKAGLFLARGGVLSDGRALLSGSTTKRLNATLLTCGAYGASSDMAYSVGLPLKTGIGGGILGVLPGIGTVCAWSPSLDAHGNSIAAAKAMSLFTTLTGWSVF
ncbi:glutaminase A [Pseudonocardiaceae bacterium YIM PH 21723]|nr:glutaminase A [Pseudonocardiaceae bacterium YIM PH 21723]